MKEEKLPISVGILAWHSAKTLENTLNSYKKNGLFELVGDVHVLLQESREEEEELVKSFGLPFLPLIKNIGIGYGFLALSECAKERFFLPLEHDWELIEDIETTRQRLLSGLEMLERGYKVVRYRHRKNYGEPLFSRPAYEGRELSHFDANSGLTSPHLMDCIHWIEEPEKRFPDKIQKEGEYFVTNSRWSNWTNNPCLMQKSFYQTVVRRFINPDDLLLEPSLAKWWPLKQYPIAWGEGLFRHNDIEKWGGQ